MRKWSNNKTKLIFICWKKVNTTSQLTFPQFKFYNRSFEQFCIVTSLHTKKKSRHALSLATSVFRFSFFHKKHAGAYWGLRRRKGGGVALRPCLRALRKTQERRFLIDICKLGGYECECWSGFRFEWRNIQPHPQILQSWIHSSES
jgi:hypothetical protein